MVDWILGVPVVVKVIGALALILAVNAFCRHLIVSVAAGALALALWSGHPAGQMATIAWRRLTSPSNLMLMLIIVLVIWLSSQMAASGVMEDLVGSVRALVSRRAAMGVLPAVIGLLPMPGGALFSAPLVDSVDMDGMVSPALKAQTNHWFRHIWEYWWPLYPGLLLSLEITGLQIWQFALIGLPLSLCAIGGGWLFLLRNVEAGADAPAEHAHHAPRRRLLGLVLPIVVVIAVYGLVRGGHAALRGAGVAVPAMNRYLPMAVGLVAAMAVLQRQRPLDREAWKRVLLCGRALNMAVIVAAVRIYGAFIEAELPGGTPLVARMHAEMDAWGVPLLLIVMLLPFVAGLATGVTIGFVGASFPIVIPLMNDGTLGGLLGVTALAFACGFMGTMLSPVHVCLIVTSEHFRTRVLPNAAGLLGPAAAVIAGGLALHFALG